MTHVAYDDLCDSCRDDVARYLAHHLETGDTWQVCGPCRSQGIRLLPPQGYQEPIAYVELDGPL